MRRALFPMLLALFAACAPAPSTGTAADEEAIRSSVTQWGVSWNNGDAKGMGALVAEDYESIDISGAHIQGRNAFVSSMSTEFGQRPQGVRMTISTGFVKWLSATSAVAGGSWTVTGPTPELSARGTWINAYQKHGGSWLAASGLGAVEESPSMPMASDTAHTHM